MFEYVSTKRRAKANKKYGAVGPKGANQSQTKGIFFPEYQPLATPFLSKKGHYLLLIMVFLGDIFNNKRPLFRE
jgi:hypothetical protein